MPFDVSGFRLLLTIVLPIAWLASEFQNSRSLRIFAGIAALSMSFLVAFVVGKLDRLNSNIWYGNASKMLIDTTVDQMERGETEQLLRELKTLQSKFEPTYENRARYDQLIEDFRSRLQ